MNQATQPDNPSAASPASLQVSLLGRFQVSAGGQPVADRQWRLRKSRNLIKLLALAPQHRLHREQVLDALWPELPAADAAHNLHQVLYIARRALDPDGGANPHLQLRDDVLSLGSESELWIDAEAFELAAGHARQTRERTAYRAALDLYAGELLPDDRYEDWASARRESLHRTYLELLSALAQLYEHDLDYPAAIETTERILASDPAQEEAHRSLMRLYALSGRRPQALRQYHLLTESLRREVDAEPDAESERLYQQILAGQFAPQTTEQLSETFSAPPQAAMSAPQSTDLAQPIRNNNLPLALDSFVGREAVMTEVKGLLARSRLVTLTGSGGCGKTRLAIQVAADLVSNYPDGVWLVEFAALSDPTLVAQEVAGVLDVREQPEEPLLNTLIDSLRNKEILLLFDNCEHLIAAYAQLAESLLRACARLRILATSREALRVAGETNYRVPSMTVPVRDERSASFDKLRMQVSAQQGMPFEAVRLFVDRVEAANRSFRLTDSNASAVAQICAQLDGMPLAIELAAARVTSLSAEQIAARLEDRFHLLTGGSRTAMPRQQTLQAAIDWSYSLLTEPERVLLRRLSVFAGGWTLEAAEAVCWDNGNQHPESLSLLSNLIEKSFVLLEKENGVVRYRALESIKIYARLKMNLYDKDVFFHERHFEWFSRLAAKAALKIDSKDQLMSLNLFDQERDNLRQAIGWALAYGKGEAALELAANMKEFWFLRGYHADGISQLTHLISQTRTFRQTPAYAKALIALALLNQVQRDYTAAKILGYQALEIGQQLEEESIIAEALADLGRLAAISNDFARARLYLEQSLEVWNEARNLPQAARILMSLGNFAELVSDFERAESLHGRALSLAETINDKNLMGGLSLLKGNLRLKQGSLDDALKSYQQALILFSEVKNIRAIISCVNAIVEILVTRNQINSSIKLLGSILSLLETSQIRLSPSSQSRYDRSYATLRARVDTGIFKVAWAAGYALTLDQAIAEAIQVTAEPMSASTTAPANAAGLTARELDVLRLLAQGLTDAQIAETLSVSTRTVNSHFRSIYSKLDVTTRTAAARYAAEFKLI